MQINQEKIFIISERNNEEIMLNLASYINVHTQACVQTHLSKNDFSLELINIYKKNILNKKNAILVVIDDYGIFPFMILGKLKFSIVAVLENEYNAKLTKEHNNSNVVILPSLILGHDLLYSIMNHFLVSKFDGGRHQGRIEMLDAILNKEGD